MSYPMYPGMPPGYAYEPLEAMFPDIYRTIRPVVASACEMYDVPSNPHMYPYPTRAGVQQMAQYIYNIVAPKYVFQEVSAEQVALGTRGLFRDLILILLLLELFRRRDAFW